MGLCDRLKEARKNAKLNQDQLAEMLGIAKTTVSGYETGRREPEMSTLYKMMDILHVDANYLFQDEMKEIEETREPTSEEFEIIKKFRKLDKHGKRTVLFLLNEEYERTQCPSLRVYTYMRKIAAAGTGFCIDDIPIETIEAPEMPGADFIIGVNGDSMQPTYFDGDLVYVKRTNSIDIGDIGIFIIAGECYIKEVGIDGLISQNENYDMIPGNEDIRCVGIVLGKVEQ